MVVARADIVGAEGRIPEAKSAYQQTVDELETKQEIYRRNPGAVAVRDIEKLQVAVQGRQGTIDAATPAKSQAEARLTSLLPAENPSTVAELAQAEVDLGKTVVRAGVNGRVEQFTLRVGDIVNPLMRPAGDGCTPASIRSNTGGEDRHGRRGDLRLEAVDRDPGGGDGRAGLHRRRTDPRQRAADRRAAGDTARHHPGVHGADLRGRRRRRHPPATLASSMPTPATTRKSSPRRPARCGDSFSTRWMPSGSCTP